MKYGFIGCGNMGGAIIKAVAKSVDPRDMVLNDMSSEKAKALAAETGAAYASIEELASGCSYIYLGVKPQGMAAMLGQIKSILASRKDRFVLVTMAAGMAMEKILELAGGSYPIIRIMPNLPVSVGEGMILYCSDSTTEEEDSTFLGLMSKAGKLCRIEEKQIDAASAVSGCGPAFVCMFIEALADGGVRCGLPRAVAQNLAQQTVLGTASLLMESGRHPGEVKDAVCSPGGTTIEGVLALENASFRAACADAVISAYEKTRKLV